MAMEITGEIEVAERGEAISQTDSEAMHELRVETDDPTSQIVVLDDRFNAVEKAAGSVAVRLPAGLYKIRVQRGAASIGFEDTLVVLDRDKLVSAKPPQLSSPAPIGGTRATDAHVAAREWLDGVVHVRLGEGSKIAVLARYAAPKQRGRRLPHPFRGLQLLRADGRLIVDLEKAAPKFYIPATAAPISVCGIAVDPGAYILRHQLTTGRNLAQSIVAAAGWQITMNIRRSQQDVDTGTEGFAGPGYIAPLMRRLIDKQSADHAPMRATGDGPIDEDQLVDIARQALADGTQLLSGNLYDLLLRDFENPLVGIVGGLLLDLEREVAGAKFAAKHAALFDVAVIKLRKMVGRNHPDVEALSFRCQDPRLAHRGAIEARPMFHRSWRIFLKAASKQPNLVPLDLWKSTIASGTMPPYLIWSLEASARRAALLRLKKAASVRSTQRNGPMELRDAVSDVSRAREVRTVPPLGSIRLEASPSGAHSVTSPRKPKTAKILREEFALDMGIPANAVLHLMEARKLVTRPLHPGKMGAKASGERQGRTEGSSAARIISNKGAVSRIARTESKKATAKRASSAGGKAVSGKATAETKGAVSAGRSASSKAKARARRAPRSVRRKSQRR